MDKRQYDRIDRILQMLEMTVKLECGSYINELVSELRVAVEMAKEEDDV